MKVQKYWYYGIILTLLASFFGALGDNLIRYSHVNFKRRSNCALNFIWYIGMFCSIVLNTLCVMGALAFADASVVVPFAAIHLVFTVILAIVINGEFVSLRSWSILIFISIGITCTVIGANKETIDYSVDDMMNLFKDPSYLVTLIICILLSVSFLLIYLKFNGISKGVGALCIGSVAGLFGSFGTVLAKQSVEVFKSSSVDPSALKRPGSYLIFILALLSGAGQIIAYNEGLKMYSASIVAPIVLTVLTIFGTILGATYFQEYKRFSKITLVTLPVGVLITVAGIILLALFEADSNQEEEIMGVGVDKSKKSLEENCAKEEEERLLH